MTFMIFFIFCWRLFFLPSPPKSRCIIVMSVHPASSEMSLVQTASFVWWHLIQKVHPRKCCPLCYCTVNQKMILGKPWACFHLTITPIRNLFFFPLDWCAELQLRTKQAVQHGNRFCFIKSLKQICFVFIWMENFWHTWAFQGDLLEPRWLLFQLSCIDL